MKHETDNATKTYLKLKMFELQGYDKFHQLRKLDYRPSNLGFGANVKTGDIVRFASRIRLAKSFRGIKVEGYSQETVSGYDAFFIVFLTHSALEQFLKINSLDSKTLCSLIATYNSEKVIQEFIKKDKEGKLYNFLYEKLQDKKLKAKLNECRNQKNTNVADLSASIRHIFAHGYLCAHTNGIYPKNVSSICTSISDFLLNFMDAEFSKKIEEFYKKLYMN
ncbi:hypothetical protein WA1_32805 [Scytonema hofmannii PCC 7110]|uniref:Uncharacterized protein n=1 Tax=Scytonema hofmannii PCC 7110 TaxID=128403 RepID=A0A139X497_9CYAN|nr:hypothetical protein [Scytonema hofmannii]KYC39496.1 hypothetical protein WA1_32805 [Scytonema hofmannii PCC 7110]